MTHSLAGLTEYVRFTIIWRSSLPPDSFSDVTMSIWINARDWEGITVTFRTVGGFDKDASSSGIKQAANQSAVSTSAVLFLRFASFKPPLLASMTPASDKETTTSTLAIQLVSKIIGWDGSSKTRNLTFSLTPSQQRFKTISPAGALDAVPSANRSGGFWVSSIFKWETSERRMALTVAPGSTNAFTFSSIFSTSTSITAGRIEQLRPSTVPMAGPAPSVRLVRFPDVDYLVDCSVETLDGMASSFVLGNRRVDFEPGNRVSCGHTGCSGSIAFPLTFQEIAADLAN